MVSFFFLDGRRERKRYGGVTLEAWWGRANDGLI
jgi:hypothetical protein